MIKKLTLIVGLLIPLIFSSAQDYIWWNKLHNWDGVTHWTKYLIISPGFMGPNALPVPEFNNGEILQSARYKMAFDNHTSQGDKTQNLYTEFFIPLYSNRVGLKMSLVPLEHYQMDDATRDSRVSRDFDGKGYAVGDLYIGTYIQIVKDHPSFPDILLTVNLRTASGTNLNAARFTDTPGYFFDMSLGKEFFINESAVKSVRPFGVLGFYVWQTYMANYYQNDAILFGIGFDTRFSKLDFTNSFGGYSGYLDNGDEPLVFRSSLKTKFNSRLNYEFGFQQGFRDFSYTTLRIGCFMDITKTGK